MRQARDQLGRVRKREWRGATEGTIEDGSMG
jgi:hypothetical protein